MDAEFQKQLQDLLNDYEKSIKQSLAYNKIPELATLQAAVNNLNFILENYQNKDIQENELMLKKINLLDSVDFSKLSYFVSPTSEEMFKDLYQKTQSLLSSGDLGKTFNKLNDKFKIVETKVKKIKKKNEENRQKERKLRVPKTKQSQDETKIILTIEQERKAKAGTLKSISNAETFSKLMSGFIQLSYFENPELRNQWRSQSKNTDPYTYFKTYIENTQNALYRLIKSKSLLDKESLQNEFSAISSYITNDDSKKSVEELMLIHSSLEKLKKLNKSLNKINDTDLNNYDALDNKRDESQNINVAIKKILNDLEEEIEKEGKVLLKSVINAKTDTEINKQFINQHIARIQMPVLINTNIPSKKVLKKDIFQRNGYTNTSTRVARESILVNDKVSEYLTSAQNIDTPGKSAPLLGIAKLAVRNSENLLEVNDYISTKNYHNLNENDKQYYDRSIEQLTQQIIANLNLIRSFELLGENPDVVEDVKKINKELIERKTQLERARKENNDESLGNKILSHLQGPWGFLNSIAVMLGLGGIFSLYKLLKEIPDQQKQLGQIRYNTAMSQVQIGADINPNYGRTFTEMGRYYHHISGMNISKEAPSKFFSALTNNIGGRYGQNPNQNSQDMFKFSTNLFAIKEAHGLDDSSFNPLIKTLYKDSNYDVETTSKLIATTITNAKSSNIPVKTYLKHVGNLVSATYELSLSAEDAMDITAHFTNKGYLIEDVTSFVKHSAQVRMNFAKNDSQMAYFGGMAGFGGDMFANIMLGRISVDRFGKNVDNYQQNLGKIMLTKYSMYEDFLGGAGDSNLALAYFGKMLKDDGYNSKEVSMAMSMKKEGKIEDLEKFLGAKNDRELKKKEDLAKAISGANAAIIANGNQLSEIQKMKADRKNAILQLAQIWEDTFGPLYDALGKLLEGFLRAAAEIAMEVYEFLMDLYNSETVQNMIKWAKEHPKSSIAGALALFGVGGAGVKLAGNAIKSTFSNVIRSGGTTGASGGILKGLAKGGGKVALATLTIGGILSFVFPEKAEGAESEDKIIEEAEGIKKSSQDLERMSKSGNAKIKLKAPRDKLSDEKSEEDNIDDELDNSSLFAIAMYGITIRQLFNKISFSRKLSSNVVKNRNVIKKSLKRQLNKRLKQFNKQIKQLQKIHTVKSKQSFKNIKSSSSLKNVKSSQSFKKLQTSKIKTISSPKTLKQLKTIETFKELNARNTISNSYTKPWLSRLEPEYSKKIKPIIDESSKYFLNQQPKYSTFKSKNKSFIDKFTTNLINKKEGLKTKVGYHLNVEKNILPEFKYVLNFETIPHSNIYNILGDAKGTAKIGGALSLVTSIGSEYMDAQMGIERPLWERAIRVTVKTGFEVGGAVVGDFIGSTLGFGVGGIAGTIIGAQKGGEAADFWLGQLGIGEKISAGTKELILSLDENMDTFGKDIHELIMSETDRGREMRKFLKDNGIDVANLTDTQNEILKNMFKRFQQEHMTLAELMNRIVENNSQGQGIFDPDNETIEKMKGDNAVLAEFFEHMAKTTNNEEYKQVYTHIANYYSHPNAGTDDKEYWENEAYQLKNLASENKTELGKRLRNNIKEKLIKEGKWNLKKSIHKRGNATYSDEAGNADDSEDEVSTDPEQATGAHTRQNAKGKTFWRDASQGDEEEIVDRSEDEVIDEWINNASTSDWVDVMGRTAYSAKTSLETDTALRDFIKAKLNAQRSSASGELDKSIMEHNWNWDPTYTDHTKLRPETIAMTNAVAKAYMDAHNGEKITLTGAAEKIGSDGRPVHQSGEYSHHSGWKVDIVANDMEWVAKWLRDHGYAAGIEDRGKGNMHVDANASGYDSRAEFKPTIAPRGGSGGQPPTTNPRPTPANSMEAAAKKAGVGLGKLRTAQYISAKVGIPVDYILAQMIVESSWEDYEAGGAYHNYGGLKVGDIGYGQFGHGSEWHTKFASDEQYADYWIKSVRAMRESKFKIPLQQAAARNDAAAYIHVMGPKGAHYFMPEEGSGVSDEQAEANYLKTFSSVLNTLQKHGITGVASGIPLSSGAGYVPKPPKTFQQEMADANAFMRKMAFASYRGRLIDGVFVDKNQKFESVEERKKRAAQMNFNVKTYYTQLAEEQSVKQLSEDVLEHQQLLSKEQEELKEIQRQKAEADKNNVALIIIKGFVKKGMSTDDMAEEIYQTLKSHKWTKDVSVIENEGVNLGGA